MLLIELVETANAVAATSSRRAKMARLGDCLRRLQPSERVIGVSYLIGVLPQGRIGLGQSALRDVLSATQSAERGLTLEATHDAFERLARTSGKGSATERRRLLGQLFSRSSEAEQDYLARLILGQLRQGALEGVMVEAIAAAARIPLDQTRRAAMLAGDLAAVAAVALAEGSEGLARFRLRLFTPVQPMLAQPSDDAAQAVQTVGQAALEYKLDGVRVQVHKQDEMVRVYTRRLNDITDRVPELVEAVRRYPAARLILDGETLAFRPDGRPEPFQVTMRRLGRTLDVERMRGQLPLTALYFDCLHLDGEDLIDCEARKRHERLTDTLPSAALIPRRVTSEPEEAERFLGEAIAAGHEGLMVKALDAGYLAGSRGAAWLKVKPAQTLDLVVLAAEWGSGRRKGLLSNLHLGTRSSGDGAFVMLGKTFKGLTDQMLEWQTRRLLELEIGREGHVVHVRPELVVEVAFNELQTSRQYPAGLALRFARVKGYRTDKGADDADSLDTVESLFRAQAGRA